MARLTEDEERRGAEMFAAGATERQVADELGVSASTAHRLRERLQGAAEGPERDVLADAEATVPQMEAEVRDAEIAALRAELAEALTDKRRHYSEALEAWQGRAAASQAAIAALDAERVERLARGEDAAPLRQRRADAVADLADAVTAASLLGAQLADADTQLALLRREDEQEAARARAEEAGRLGDELAPQAEAALKAAVTGDGTAKALTDLAVRLAGAERVSGRSWDHLVVPPSLALLGGRDPWHWAISDLWRAARRGDVAAVMVILPRCSPWIDRDRAEFARLQAEAEARQRQASAEATQRLQGARQGATQTMITPAMSRGFLAEMRGAAMRSMADADRRQAAAVEAVRDHGQ